MDPNNPAFPMWDSFEALFFAMSGVSVGFVLGFLFPSLWRTFRRQFRRNVPYLSVDEKNQTERFDRLHILDQDEPDDVNAWQTISLLDAFILARYHFQQGNIRECIKLYLKILTYENISKQDTNLAFFELAQSYAALELYGRAFDIGFELLNRKPQHTSVFIFLVKLCSQQFLPEKLDKILHIYKGNPSQQVRFLIVHALCQIGDFYLSKNQLQKSLELARKAMRRDRLSARSMLLLWKSTSLIFNEQNRLDGKLMWLAFANDLESYIQIGNVSGVSPAAESEYIADLIENLQKNPFLFEDFSVVQTEFSRIFKGINISSERRKKLLESLFYARPILERRKLIDSQILTKILSHLSDAKVLASDKNLTNHQEHMAVTLGYSVHTCRQCQSSSLVFAWKCEICAELESFVPLIVPLLE